jgi:MFS family permease
MTDRPILLRHRSLLMLWLGQLTSQAGTRMYQIGLAWWIVSTFPEKAGRDLSIFMLMGALPSVLLVKPIGRLIDRARSRTILVLSDVANAAVTALVAWLLWTDHLTMAAAWTAGLAVAVFQSLFDPTLNKAVPEVVDPGDVEAAVAVVSSTQSLANFGGAVAGALLVDTVGVAGVAALDAASYVVSALVNTTVRFRPQVAKEPAAGVAGVATDDLSGWQILDGMPLLRAVLVRFGLTNFFITPTLVILPLYTKLVLAAPASVLGLLEASLWIGLLAGTVVAARVGRGTGPLTLAALCLGTMGVCLGLPGLVVHRQLYMALLFVAGLALGVNNVKFVTTFQEVVDPRIKGRFFALMQALVGFGLPVAYLAFGWLATVLGPATTTLLQGAGVLVLAGDFLRLSARQADLVKGA